LSIERLRSWLRFIRHVGRTWAGWELTTLLSWTEALVVFPIHPDIGPSASGQ
jgi:hypothetical protein